MTDSVTIRPLSADEYEAAIATISEVGWSGLSAYFAFYLRDADCHPFVAEAGGQIVGTAAGIRKNNVGWLGHVIVGLAVARPGHRHFTDRHGRTTPGEPGLPQPDADRDGAWPTDL